MSMNYKTVFSGSLLVLLIGGLVWVSGTPVQANSGQSDIVTIKIGDAQHGGKPYHIELTGAAEVPGPGDSDGSGHAIITLNPGQGEVCFEITVENIDPITAAHIHRGTADVAGPAVVNFNPTVNGLSGCIENVSKDLIKDIIQNPENYYVNVHNASFPAGALRGQMSD